MYIKTIYADDPLFENVKVIYSVYDNYFEGVLSDTIADKLLYEKLEKKDVEGVKVPNINNLHKFATDYADAVVQASPAMDKDLLAYIKKSEKSFMEYPGEEDYIDAYQDFYAQFIEVEDVVITEE
jgi:starch synthase